MPSPLASEEDYYRQLTSILVYPSSYTAHEKRHVGANIWEEGDEHRLGHTGRRLGSLVLAWETPGAARPILRMGEILSYTNSRISSTSRTTQPTARRLWQRKLNTNPGRG